MTFKEVDEKINHYEIELKKCVDEIAQTELFLENDNDEVKNLAKAHKLKVEFFCFVTTSYIDWLCVYRNLQRSKLKRLEYHLYSRGKFTSKAKDWKIVYTQEFSNKTEALLEEKRLKKLNRISLERLIKD